MKPTLPVLVAALLTISPLTTQAADCACSQASLTEQPAPGHPLKGIIIDILPERSALLVKHEEIPGVMKAMTMLLKVDAPTLQAAQKNQAITATLLKKPDGWWLENVTPTQP